MPALLSRVLGTDAPHGVLAAMPARHWAFIHVLADKTPGPSLLKMAAMARVAHGQEQGPISPEVFWWRDGGWMPVPSAESGGEGCSTVTRRGGADDILGATAITRRSAMPQAPGTRPAPACTPLSAEEKARGEVNFTPYVAQMLLARGRFRVSADTPEMVELFQKVARRVGDMLRRPVVSYANGREIVITFGQEEPPGVADQGTLSLQD
jgi:hypothetical protein